MRCSSIAALFLAACGVAGALKDTSDIDGAPHPPASRPVIRREQSVHETAKAAEVEVGPSAAMEMFHGLHMQRTTAGALPTLLQSGGPAGTGGIILEKSGSFQDPNVQVTAVWTRPGPQGLPGPKGAAGVKGLQGPYGPPGLDVDAGQVDFKRMRGPQGPDGPKGPQGDEGEQGPMGPVGPAGDKGLSGKFTDEQKKTFDRYVKQLDKAVADAKEMDFLEHSILTRRFSNLQSHFAQLEARLQQDELRVRAEKEQSATQMRQQVAQVTQKANATRAAIQKDKQMEKDILEREAALRQQVLTDTQALQNDIQ